MTPEDIAKLPYRPCVGLVVLNRRGEIFAGQRLDNLSDAWQMPQGGVDEGETPLDAALRELEEETGIRRSSVRVLAETADWIPYDLPVELVPRLWKGRFRGQTQKWFLLRFEGDDTEVTIETEHPEFETWRWARLSELVDMAIEFKRDTYRQVVAEFAPHFPEDAR